MMAIFTIVQGIASKAMETAGFGEVTKTVLPTEIVTAVESCGFFESIPLWAVTLIRWAFYNYIIIYYDTFSISEDFSKSTYIQQFHQ